jgi:hypothetical protein
LQTSLLVLGLLLTANDDSLAPWGTNRHASDVPKREVREISAPRAENALVQDGTTLARRLEDADARRQGDHEFLGTWKNLASASSAGPHGSVTLERDLRRLDGEALKWGHEKVVASGLESVGSSTQSFVIDVRP